MNKGAENMYVSIPGEKTGGDSRRIFSSFPERSEGQTNGLSMNIFLARTQQLMGGKFKSYSERDNNCQHFILALLQSNDLSSPESVLFTKQSTQHIFTPELRKLTNTITDVASKINIIRGGIDIKKKY